MTVTVMEYRSNGTVISGSVSLTASDTSIVQTSGNLFTVINYGEADLSGNYIDADGNDHPYALHVLAVEPNQPFPVFTTNVAFNISGSYATQKLGNQMTVTVMEYRSNGTVISGNIDLQSSDPSVVEVSGNTFTPVSYGEADLSGNYIDADGNDHPYALHVYADSPTPIIDLQLLVEPVVVYTQAIPYSESYEVYLLKSDGSRENVTSQVSVTTSNSSVVTASGGTITVHNFSQSAAHITYSYNGMSAKTTVIAVEPNQTPPVVQIGLEINPSFFFTQAVPYHGVFTVERVMSDGSRVDVTNTVNYSSSDPTVATAANSVVTVSDYSENAVYITVSDGIYKGNITVLSLEPEPEYIAYVRVHSQPDSVWVIANGRLLGETEQNVLLDKIELDSGTETVLITGRKKGYYDYSIDVELSVGDTTDVYLTLDPIVTPPTVNVSCGMVVDIYDAVPNISGFNNINCPPHNTEYEVNVRASGAYSAVLQVVSRYGTEIYYHSFSGGVNETWYSGPYSYNDKPVLFYLTVEDDNGNKAYAVSVAKANVILNFNP
jgi:hypothetical protein